MFGFGVGGTFDGGSDGAFTFGADGGGLPMSEGGGFIGAFGRLSAAVPAIALPGILPTRTFGGGGGALAV